MRHLAALLLVCLALVGCRSDPSIELLESELRRMEDQVYALKDDYGQKCSELASCRRENNTLRARLRGSSTYDPPSEPDDGDDLPSLPDLGLPRIESGRPSSPELDLSDGNDDPDDDLTPRDSEAPPFSPSPPPSPSPDPVPDALDLPSPKILDPPPAPPPPERADIDLLQSESRRSAIGPRGRRGDKTVTQIELNERLTGGYNFDGHAGDEGLEAVIEPRNAQGRYVPLAGPVSIVLLDPAKSGESARVARWDFDAADARRHLRRSLFGRGIHLELPWPNQPPEHRDLHLYVRYTTVDGQHLDNDMRINVELTGQPTNRWTPALRSRRQLAESPASRRPEPKHESPMTVADASPSPSAEESNHSSSPAKAATRDVPPARLPRWSPHRSGSEPSPAPRVASPRPRWSPGRPTAARSPNWRPFR